MRRIALLLITLGLVLGGCGHVATVPQDDGPIVLAERTGSTAATIIEMIVGQSPKAVTFAGKTVVFQPSDAADVCLLAHEETHATDQITMGLVQWSTAYAVQLAECELRDRQPRAWCLRNVALERRAYEVQHRCQAEPGRFAR